MRAKLTLVLEDLAVDTFETIAPARQKGTVFGEQCTCWTYCGQNTCPGCPTCANYNTCDATCPATCDDPSCGGGCTGYTCDYSCNCNTWDPCPTAHYTYCNGIECY